MILQALYELAQAEQLIGDPDFEYKPISWVIRLREDGTLVNIEDHRRNVNEGKTTRSGKSLNAKWQGKNEVVPVQPTRTSGDSAFFLVDKAEYVFGIDPNGKRPPDKLAQRAGLFRERLETCAANSGDPGTKVVVNFLRSIEHNAPALPEDVTASDLFAFRVGESGFVHLRPEVKAWWKQQREAEEGDARYRCLITGEPVVTVELFPQIKRVPGGTPSGVALVSHNLRAFESYGLSGNDNAPVSRAASQAAAAALNRLLHREPDKAFGRPDLKPRHVRLSNDTVVVYWSPHGDPDALDAIAGLTEAESTEVVADAYKSVWRGEPPTLRDASRFYAMTLTGTQGRLIVRDWFETTVDDVLKSLGQYFEHISIDDAWRRGNAQPPSLWQLKSSLALDPAKIPSTFMQQWWRVVTRPKLALPASIVARVLDRLQATVASEGYLTPTPFALLRLYLVRQGDSQMGPHLNKLHPRPAYHCGRLMAILSRVQDEARGEGQTNATVNRKFFGAVMTSPGLYFGRLLALAEKAHLRKIGGDRESFFRDNIAEVLSAMGDDMPRMLRMEDQSYFVLGFYQQMAHLAALPPMKMLRATTRGVWVQSYGEQVVANALTAEKIDWWYDTEVPVDNRQRYRRPDFYIPSPNPSARVFLEVLGKMDDEQYQRDWEAKKQDYRLLGILPHEEKGDASGGRLYWINTTRPKGERLDPTAIREQIKTWFGYLVDAVDPSFDEPSEEPDNV